MTDVTYWVRTRITVETDLKIDELTAELGLEHGLEVHRSSVGQLLGWLGLSHKKDLQALEQKQQDIAAPRYV